MKKFEEDWQKKFNDPSKPTGFLDQETTDRMWSRLQSKGIGVPIVPPKPLVAPEFNPSVKKSKRFTFSYSHAAAIAIGIIATWAIQQYNAPETQSFAKEQPSHTNLESEVKESITAPMLPVEGKPEIKLNNTTLALDSKESKKKSPIVTPEPTKATLTKSTELNSSKPVIKGLVPEEQPVLAMSNGSQAPEKAPVLDNASEVKEVVENASAEAKMAARKTAPKVIHIAELRPKGEAVRNQPGIMKNIGIGNEQEPQNGISINSLRKNYR